MKIVVEGAGDVVLNKYGPALQKLRTDNNDLKVIVTDDSALWSDVPGLREKRTLTIRQLEGWGATFLDKSAESGRSQYDELRKSQVDVVFVATNDQTHVSVAEGWLQNGCQIFIEKPLTNNIDQARRLLGRIGSDNYRVRAFDHYRARVHLHLGSKEFLKMVLGRLGRITAFHFYLLEDHSGTDKQYRTSLDKERLEDRNGPIENERRQQALANGLVLDLMPHMPALLAYFGDPATIQVTHVRAARYVGVDYDDEKKTEIPRETFAAVGFQFKAHDGEKVTGDAYIGKGVRGSKRYPGMDGNVKVLELEGQNLRGSRQKILFDFRRSCADILHGKGTPRRLLELERDPYYYLVKQVHVGDDKGTTLGMPVETGKRILEVLEDIRYSTNGEISSYRLGDKKGRCAPYLEDLISGSDRLPLLYGSEPQQ
jgi:predicted dehydrogenase